MTSRQSIFSPRTRRLSLVAALALSVFPAFAVAAEPAASTESLLVQARIAMREGHMLAPAGGSAFELYLRAHEAAPFDSRAREALNDLFPLTKQAVEGAIARGDYAEARRMIELVDRAMPGSLTVSNLRTRLQQTSPSVASTR
jgi:hypothetical protein